MRDNGPVTQRELVLVDDTTLISTTDLSSYITYANASFCEVSGFSTEELLGQPHNIVRHPDMPPEAFADMWATLQSGQWWSALVKNRRKNGDHYWVRANVTPIGRAGELTGFMSVRTKPAPDEVAAAEKAYAEFRARRAGSSAFHKGLIVRTGWMAWKSLGRTLAVHWRIRLAMAVVGLLPVLAALAAGVGGSQILMLAAMAALAVVAGSAWLEAQIARPLKQMLAHAMQIAVGDPGDGRGLDRVDDIGMIYRAIDQAGLNLKSLVADISEQVGGLRTVSGEIASGNLDLSQRTEEQASNLQQTAASMEQLTATVRQNADSAGEASRLASNASDAAARGGTLVGQVVDTMQDITASSRRINDIIGVIDGIAFQTNILALNAAVEAARAGEHGRGFAVVASDVRALAQRSSVAAGEIKALIGASVDKVESGRQLVDDAGVSMQDIVGQTRLVTNLIAEISSASREQTQGIGQVGEAVNELDQMTQQNAAMVEESAAAAESLKHQAASIDSALKIFRTGASQATMS